MKRTFSFLAFAAFGLCLLIAACNPSNPPGEEGKPPDSSAMENKEDSVAKSAGTDGRVVVSDGDSEQDEGDSID